MATTVTYLSYTQHKGKDAHVSAWAGDMDVRGRVLTEENGFIAVRYPSRGTYVYRRLENGPSPWTDKVERVLVIR